MNNVLMVKTHVTDGRAWAAWVVNPESAKAVEFLVSVNGKRRELKVFAVNDQSTVRFVENGQVQDVDRVAFDIIDITGTRAGKKIVASLGDPFLGTWVTKYSTY